MDAHRIICIRLNLALYYCIGANLANLWIGGTSLDAALLHTQ